MSTLCKFAGALACVLVPCAALAQDQPAAAAGQEGAGARGRGPSRDRPYERVVTRSEVRCRDLHRPSHQGPRLLRDPKDLLGGSSCG